MAISFNNFYDRKQYDCANVILCISLINSNFCECTKDHAKITIFTIFFLFNLFFICFSLFYVLIMYFCDICISMIIKSGFCLLWHKSSFMFNYFLIFFFFFKYVCKNRILLTLFTQIYLYFLILSSDLIGLYILPANYLVHLVAFHFSR